MRNNSLREIRLDLITSIGERHKSDRKVLKYAAIIKALRNCENCFSRNCCIDIECRDSGEFINWSMGVATHG